MTYKENITAILECCFAGFKEEIIEASTIYIYTKTRVLKGGSQDYLRKQITFRKDWWNSPYKKEV